MLASLRTAFTNHIAAKSTLARRRRRAANALVEALEPRTLLTAFVVNTLVDESNGINVGNVSLRDAINAANASAGPDSITFAPTLTAGGPATITLTNGEIDFTDTSGLTTITGPGANLLTISGNNASRIFGVSASASASISGLTLANGNDATQGGAIQNLGTLTLASSTLSHNTAGSLGGAIYANQSSTSLLNCSFSNNTTPTNTGDLGGALYQFAGNVIVANSTFSGNSAGYGGAFYNIAGTLTVADSTFSANTASNFGGAIFNDTSLVLSGSTFSGNTAVDGGGLATYNLAAITNTTFAGNTATAFGGGIYNFGTANIADSTISGNHATGAGGGLNTSSGNLSTSGTLTNTIIAGNTGTIPDVDGAVASGSYNFIGIGDSLAGITNGVNGNQIGTAASPIDPLLGPLANNGGPVQTMALLAGSPAIDAGDPAFAAPPATDARGVARVANSRLDIGAYEAQKIHLVITAPAEVGAGAPFNFTLTALDEFDQPVLGYTNALTITSSDSAAILPTGVALDRTTGTGTFAATLNSVGTFTLTAQDSFAPSINNTTNITVDANAAPIDLNLSSASIPENQPAGTALGTLSSTDPNPFNTFTYSLVPGTGSADNASFTISGNSLLTAASFDFEAKASYSIRIRTTDQGGLFTEKAFTINVTNVNEAPTTLALSSTSIAEKRPVGTTVGTLSTTDPDAGDSFTYSLVSGTGSADNASFSISGNSLKTAAVFAYATQHSFSIRLRTTDQGGLFTDQTFTITIPAPPPVARLTFLLPTPNVVAGITQSRVITLHVLNANGTLNTTSKTNVTLKILSGPAKAKLNGKTILTPSKGSVTFGKFSFTIGGVYTLQATDPGFAAATSVFTVWAAPSVSLRFNKIPVTVAVGAPFLVRVSAYDRFGNMNTRDNRFITLSLGTHPSRSVLNGTLKLHLIAGSIAFRNLSVTKSGKYTLKATDGLKLNLTSNKITVTA